MKNSWLYRMLVDPTAAEQIATSETGSTDGPDTGRSDQLNAMSESLAVRVWESCSLCVFSGNLSNFAFV